MINTYEGPIPTVAHGNCMLISKKEVDELKDIYTRLEKDDPDKLYLWKYNNALKVSRNFHEMIFIQIEVE